MLSGARDSGAAVRRRQRRLRAQLRHEQQSVAMAVAAALHHSAYKKSLPEKEVVEGGTHSARQGQKTAAGTRPAPLAEVAEPQGLSVAPRCPDASVPSLSTPSLADTAAEAVDARTVRFLLQAELKQRKEEEEEEMQELERRVDRNEQLTPEESYAWRKWAGLLPGGKRKRKKKRKKKVPKTSSSSSSRLNAHHVRRVPGCFVSVRSEMHEWCCDGLRNIPSRSRKFFCYRKPTTQICSSSTWRSWLFHVWFEFLDDWTWTATLFGACRAHRCANRCPMTWSVTLCLSSMRFSGEHQLASASCTSPRLLVDDFEELIPSGRGLLVVSGQFFDRVEDRPVVAGSTCFPRGNLCGVPSRVVFGQVADEFTSEDHLSMRISALKAFSSCKCCFSCHVVFRPVCDQTALQLASAYCRRAHVRVLTCGRSA